jgi:8-oxo-dGTP pyrophosphatase MutT (NUDIX family)
VTSFASVILVDPRGWLLLQERDEHARISPDCWGFVGGHVEPGEDVERAAHRELGEETGLVSGDGALTGPLRLWRSFTAEEDGATIWVFTGATRATDSDVVCGEGRQIVFVEPTVAVQLPLSEVAAAVVPVFLDSPEYARLAP